MKKSVYLANPYGFSQQQKHGLLRARARLWPQPLGLVLLEGVRESAERIGRKHER